MAVSTSSIAAGAAKKWAGASYTRSKSSRSTSSSTMTITTDKPFISLQAFDSNFFFLVAVQDNDAIFEETFQNIEAGRITET
jgi:hypothetical protein